VHSQLLAGLGVMSGCATTRLKQDFPHFFDIDRPMSRNYGTYCDKEVEWVEFFKSAVQTLERGTLSNVIAIKNS
jgi:hypothetical protein